MHQLAYAGITTDPVPANFGNHRLAVIGLLYDLGTSSHCNSFLATFWDYFPQDTGLKEYTGTNPNLNLKLSDELAQGYYHWYGSLTSPPCTEGVSWNLLTAREKVCPAQVLKLTNALKITQNEVAVNNRVTQPLNHRAVSLLAPGNPRPSPKGTAILSPSYGKLLPVLTTWAYAPALALAADATEQGKWGGLCSAGQEQSPINVISQETIKGGLPTIATSFATTVSYVKTGAHGFQLFEMKKAKHNLVANIPTAVTPAATKGSSMIGGDKFNFYQVSWHSPSENTIDGVAFAMEAQFVHQLDDTTLANTYHRLAVIALLYSLGADTECNPFLKHFWDKFPATAGPAPYMGNNLILDFNKKLKDELAVGYYHWMGSLTSPPCTEGVSWNLLKTKEKVCTIQVNTIKAALASTQSGINFNNRVTHPLNHRLVTEMSPDIGDSRRSSMTTAHWTKGIEMAQKQRVLSQKMTSEFLYVAMGLETAANRVLMLASSAAFEANLKKLVFGSTADSIAPVPTQLILNQLWDVQFKWINMKRLLELNVDTIQTSAKKGAVLEELFTQNMLILTASGVAVSRYTFTAESLGITTAGLVVEVADRQRMLSQKMAKEALFIGLNVRKTEILDELAKTMSLFQDSHRDIVRGVGSLTDMPQLAEVCTLAQMKEVNGAWNAVQPSISQIVDSQEASAAALKEIMLKTPILLGKLDSAVTMYLSSNNICDLASKIGAHGWVKSLSEVARQRVLTQKALRLFTQVVRGVQLEESKTALTTAMSEGLEATRICVEGSYYLGIPSPPTQAFVTQLFVAQAFWWKATGNIERDMLASELSTIDVSKTLTYGDLCTSNMDKVATMYIDASLTKLPNLPSVMVEISWRQLTLLQRMVKASVLVSLGKDTASNKIAFASFAKTFDVSHYELLMGRVVHQGAKFVTSTDGVALLHPLRAFARTQDACILTLMAQVLTQYKGLHNHLEAVVSGTVESSEHISTFGHALSALSSTSGTMTMTVVKYSTLPTEIVADVCGTQLSADQWESGIQNAGKPTQLFLSAQKEFFLIASGLADGWLTAASNALVEHQGFISDDVESPMLLEALTAFKDGWFQIGKSDAEREFALKTAYITQNPHPIGNKLNLDFAPGPEAYHAAHKKYHVVYRDILYTRNYYDVFIFDTTGNLIYSVYKELDFATNFDQDGAGEWKMSGLGDAFMAAMANPEVVSIIDWKPYGPSAGALASFLSKGILSPAGMVVGVYSTQMPPESKPINATELLIASTGSFDQLVLNLKFGVPSDKLPPPPKQVIATSLFAVESHWQTMHALLKGPATVKEVEFVRANAPGFLAKTEALLTTYVDEAWVGDTSVPGTKILIASRQIARMQELAGDSVLVYLGPRLKEAGASEVTPEEVTAKMQTIEDDHLLLMTGRLDRRLANHLGDERVPLKTDVAPSTDAMSIKLMDDFHASWTSLKGTLTSIVVPAEDGSTEATSESLRTMVESTDAAAGAMDQSVLFYASKITAIVLEPISIMAPMPLTGAWNAGVTMRAAARIAEEYINEEQILLPSYSLNHVFFDDKCISTVSSQIVLREMASDVNYIGIGGSGCTTVCAGTAFVAASIRLPYLSYDCSGHVLSDTSEYPDITRFGTVTTPQVRAIKAIKAEFTEWTHVEVVSADPGKFRDDGERLVTLLAEIEVEGQYAFAYEHKWDDIIQVMDALRKKKRRAIFVMGTEAFFRKLICASIVVLANSGISWLSDGAWREEWWTKSDSILDSHQAWIKEDSGKQEVKVALNLFNNGWDAAGDTDEARAAVLFPLYVTDEKENLDFVAGPLAYHTYHKSWHPVFRKQMIDRNYYDVFMFDMRGNLVYSVYKESDFATNFGTNKNLAADFRKWQASGLGDAFRAALIAPDVVTMTPWTPYGPSAGALASFLAIGVRDASGNQIGVFSTQMPPDTMSIDYVEPDCSLEAIAQSFEGSINFVGLGKPLESEMEQQVPCFKGRTAKAFTLILDDHLVNGYPLGDESTIVTDPYHDVKANAADGTCVFAYALRHLMLNQGISLDDIKQHTEEAYKAFVDYIKLEVEFQGISGFVNFTGNDKPAYLAVQQVQAGKKVLVGTVNDTVDLTVNGGPSNASWKPSHPDVPPPEADFPYWVFQVFLPLMCLCCPGLAGCVRNF